jgi:Flp pilus assembly protein TadG
MNWFGRFSHDRRGIAAVEFALVVSIIMLPLFIGLVEILTLYRAEIKLSALTTNIAQMVAYEAESATGNTLLATTSSGITASTLQSTSLKDICTGAISGLGPFPGSGITIAIASVTLEANKNGLPTTSSVYTTGAPAYDVWETDFSVSGGSCTTTSGTSTYTAGTASTMTGSATIGATNAELLATSSPPSTSGSLPAAGATSWPGMLAVPCDNAIIVQAKMTYPGMIGLILQSRPTLTQSSYARWANSWNQAELQCTGTGCNTQFIATQLCTSSNITATN